MNGIRISKLLSARGVCSRREADHFLEMGWVRVDGRKALLGERVEESAQIELSDQAQKALTIQHTFLLNKPVGYVSNLPENNYKEAVELLTVENRDARDSGPLVDPRKLAGIAAAGRLDIDSQGLIVFTQNGRIAKQLIGEETKIEKEYLVRVEGKLSAENLKLLQYGLSLDDKKLKACKVEWINDDQLKFVLMEGKKRQVRRMCELVGLRVTGLKRVRIGKVMLGSLPEGKWRLLKPDESF